MMALNISKNTACSSNVSGLLVKSALSFGYLTLGFSGSGSSVYTTAIETGWVWQFILLTRNLSMSLHFVINFNPV